MRRAKLDVNLGVLCEAVTKIKLQDRHFIIIGGDLNNYDITPAINNFLDIIQIQSLPTRDTEQLDIVYSNNAAAFAHMDMYVCMYV